MPSFVCVRLCFQGGKMMNEFDLLSCPFCNSVMFENGDNLFCSNFFNCEVGHLPVPKKYVKRCLAYKNALCIALEALNKCKTREHIGAVCRIPDFVDSKIEEIREIIRKGESDDNK